MSTVTNLLNQECAACMDAGEINSILRCFDEKGMPKGIILQKGKLPDGECFAVLLGYL